MANIPPALTSAGIEDVILTNRAARRHKKFHTPNQQYIHDKAPLQEQTVPIFDSKHFRTPSLAYTDDEPETPCTDGEVFRATVQDIVETAMNIDQVMARTLAPNNVHAVDTPVIQDAETGKILTKQGLAVAVNDAIERGLLDMGKDIDLPMVNEPTE